MYIPGIEYELHQKHKKKGLQVKTCKVIQECERFIVIDLGNYRETVEKYKLKNGEIKLMRKGDKEMSIKPKITREQLIKECHDNGTDRNALEAIAKKYELAYLTLYTYFNKWKIKDEINNTKYTNSTNKESAIVMEKNKDQFLKPASFAGKHFKYILLAEGKVYIDIDDHNLILNLDDIDNFINELKELKQHIT